MVKKLSPLTLVRWVTTTSFLTVTLPSLCWKMKSFFTPEKSLRRGRKDHMIIPVKKLWYEQWVILQVSKHSSVSNRCNVILKKREEKKKTSFQNCSFPAGLNLYPNTYPHMQSPQISFGKHKSSQFVKCNHGNLTDIIPKSFPNHLCLCNKRLLLRQVQRPSVIQVLIPGDKESE